jgi:hypothetical protein
VESVPHTFSAGGRNERKRKVTTVGNVIEICWRIFCTGLVSFEGNSRLTFTNKCGMKKFFIFILLASFGFELLSQDLAADKVPAAALMSFKQYYPEVSHARWSFFPDSSYGVVFMIGKWRHFSRCDKDGKWLQHDERISYLDLPPPIRTTTEQKFAGYEPKYISQFDSVGKPLTYEVFLLRENEFYVVRFSPAGEILKNDGKQKIEWKK